MTEKTYLVPVTWTMRGNAVVTAKNKRDALKLAEGQQIEDVVHEESISDYEVTGDPEEIVDG